MIIWERHKTQRWCLTKCTRSICVEARRLWPGTWVAFSTINASGHLHGQAHISTLSAYVPPEVYNAWVEKWGKA